MPEAYTINQIKHVLQNMPIDKRVRRLILFGSHVKGTAEIQSDMDFFLDSDNRITGFAYFDLKGRLEDAFKRDIDLIPDVDVIPGSKVDEEIRKTGVMVYGR
ncbi:MAG: nucleotidyltransferase domain-containing protein [Clostridia bacterium]|nr:nucleotidyltransferase domain-containing protein [Clostridia bacterium]